MVVIQYWWSNADQSQAKLCLGLKTSKELWTTVTLTQLPSEILICILFVLKDRGMSMPMMPWFNKKIQSQADADSLQTDLNTMVDWSHRWQMSFNPKKCSLVRVTKKRKIIQHTYNMMGIDLDQTEHSPYLGVEISSNLEWKHHIKTITGKAKKTLYFLQRNLYNCPPEVKKKKTKNKKNRCTSHWLDLH